jgi:hypothetical protein
MPGPMPPSPLQVDLRRHFNTQEEDLMKTNMLARTVACATLALAAQMASAVCLQDQYGGQYNITYNAPRTTITGTYSTSGGVCGATWSLIGSWVTKGSVRHQELTAANPDPLGAGSDCVPMFKLKGKYPNFAWYYTGGYGAQESRFVACTPAASSAAESMRSVSGTGISK